MNFREWIETFLFVKKVKLDEILVDEPVKVEVVDVVRMLSRSPIHAQEFYKKILLESSDVRKYLRFLARCLPYHN